MTHLPLETDFLEELQLSIEKKNNVIVNENKNCRIFEKKYNWEKIKDYKIFEKKN